MKLHSSKIGGEGSNGGIIFAPSRCRDGTLSILKLLSIIKKRKAALRDLIYALPKYTTLRKDVKGELNRSKIEKFFIGEGYTIQSTGDTEGGLKAIKDDSWIWFRKSKTEHNLLRIIVDARDKDVAERLLEEGAALLN